jgi:hypothetical protein
VILSRISPEGFDDPKDFKDLPKTVSEKIKLRCPCVTCRESFATQAELDAMRLTVFQQIQDALVRANSAKRLVDLYQNSLRSQSEATLRSTVIAYENDPTDILNLLDSQNTTLDVDYAYFRAVADLEQRMAELELAVGAPVPTSGQMVTGSPEVMR